MSNLDVDDDGDVSEGVASEISAIHDQLNKVIVDYASSISKQPIIYDAHAYPYFFNDNYQFVAKDPGAYAHNPDYVIQLLIDSINDVGEVLELPDNGYLRPE